MTMNENIDYIKKLLSARPKGKTTVWYKGKWYRIDFNYNPPRATEMKEQEEE